MQDRFRFRGYCEKSFIDDDDNDYEKKFYLDDLSVDRYGDCGIFYDDLVEQLKEQGFTDKEIETVVDAYDCDYDWVAFTPELLVQCTGFKDKNGNLIYEGDIIRSPYNKHYEYADYVVAFIDGAFAAHKCLGMKDAETGEIKDCSRGGYCWCDHITEEYAKKCEVIGRAFLKGVWYDI